MKMIEALASVDKTRKSTRTFKKLRLISAGVLYSGEKHSSIDHFSESSRAFRARVEGTESLNSSLARI